VSDDDERPRVGQIWQHRYSGLLWVVVSADPLMLKRNVGYGLLEQTRCPRPERVTKVYRRRV
jgi:hypothetical protein